MKADRAAKLLKKAIAGQADTSPKERFQRMVDQGVINAEGRVLVRGPNGAYVRASSSRSKKKPAS
jgi:hypothetical protein